MALSIGIVYATGIWKICLTENGQVLEHATFADVRALFSSLAQTCVRYPEASIGISSPLEISLLPFIDAVQNLPTEDAGDQNLPAEDAVQYLQAENAGDQYLPAENAGDQIIQDVLTLMYGAIAVNLQGYSLPTLKFLPSVQPYRRLKRKQMGTSAGLCAVATLLYRMRQQEATWSEMRFLYVEVSDFSYSIIVVQDGCIVDGSGDVAPVMLDEANEKDVELAFWESLMQDLAGLMAIHHFEDIVITDHRSPGSVRRSTVIDRLGDNYQFYLFPQRDSDPPGFEAAIGAAILAEGLSRAGLATEVTAQLLSSLI